MDRITVYLAPAILFDTAGDLDDDPALLISAAEASGLPPVFAWTSAVDVVDDLVGGWDWSHESSGGAETVYILRPEALEVIDLAELDERARGIGVREGIDSHDLEVALDADTVTEHAENPLGALVIAVHTLRNVVLTAADNEAGIAVVVRRG